MLMIVLGVVFDGVAFSERVRAWYCAGSLLAGSVVFPLGVILQTSRTVPFSARHGDCWDLD